VESSMLGHTLGPGATMPNFTVGVDTSTPSPALGPGVDGHDHA